MMIGTDCTGSCKSNHNAITTTTVPHFEVYICFVSLCRIFYCPIKRQKQQIQEIQLRTSSLLYTVDSILFVRYQFSWISWEQVNHEFKYQTYCNFSVDLFLKKWRNHEIKYPRNLILFYIHENWYPRK